MKKKKIVAGLIIIASLGLVGCSSITINEDANIRDESIGMSNSSANHQEAKVEMDNEPDTNGDINSKVYPEGKVVKKHDLGEFTFVTQFSLNPKVLANWKMIDRKNIKMEAWTEGLPEGYEVLIDNVHSDMYILNASNELPSLKQDSMDDRYHGYSQDGFYIDNDVRYQSIFSIDPTNETFISGYSGYIRTETISERRLERDFFYGNELFVVYDLLIKGPEDKFYKTKSISQPLIILKPNYREIIYR